jgi:hypothetical protein
MREDPCEEDLKPLSAGYCNEKPAKPLILNNLPKAGAGGGGSIQKTIRLMSRAGVGTKAAEEIVITRHRKPVAGHTILDTGIHYGKIELNGSCPQNHG